VREPRFAGTPTDWQAACSAAAHLPEALDDAAMRRFVEAHFVPFLVEDGARPQGLFTGYYEALARGSRRPL